MRKWDAAYVREHTPETLRREIVTELARGLEPCPDDPGTFLGVMFIIAKARNQHVEQIYTEIREEAFALGAKLTAFDVPSVVQ